MKNKKIISMTLAMIILLGMSAACAQQETIYIPNPEDVEVSEEIIIDLSLEMVPLSAFPAVSNALMPVASGRQVKNNDKSSIDHSNTADGYVMAKWLKTTTKELRVQVVGPSGTAYTYTIKPNNTYEVFPLSDGNGSYTVRVLEQTEGSKFAAANSVTLDVKLKDEFAPFLRPNQYVNFKTDSKVVAEAAKLMTGKKDVIEKVGAIYNFVVSNLTYDKELAANVKSGYLPDVDAVLAKKKGICFDYAAVMVAMLRSQGIPTKLVVGYAGDVYHAWVNVYSSTTGWVTSVIHFDGVKWHLMDPTFASTSNNSASFQTFVGTGSNYSVKYLY
jgi:hypothetical protein